MTAPTMRDLLNTISEGPQQSLLNDDIHRAIKNIYNLNESRAERYLDRGFDRLARDILGENHYVYREALNENVTQMVPKVMSGLKKAGATGKKLIDVLNKLRKVGPVFKAAIPLVVAAMTVMGSTGETKALDMTLGELQQMTQQLMAAEEAKTNDDDRNDRMENLKAQQEAARAWKSTFDRQIAGLDGLERLKIGRALPWREADFNRLTQTTDAKELGQRLATLVSRMSVDQLKDIVQRSMRGSATPAKPLRRQLPEIPRVQDTHSADMKAISDMQREIDAATKRIRELTRQIR